MTSRLTGTKTPNGKGFQDPDEECPVCRNTRYLTPNMRLLVSECYHKMCQSCIDRLFANGATECPIPGCKKTLRKISFVEPTFEDLSVEKEVRIRKRLASQFNKRREDFNSPKEYNDYLEMVEQLVWNLNNDIDPERTKARIESFALENKEIIAKNARKQSEEEEWASRVQDNERKKKQKNFEEYTNKLAEEKKAKEAHKAEVIELLANSTESAKLILKKRGIARERSNIRSQDSIDNDNGGIGELWIGLDKVSQEEETQEFDPIASEYMDIDHYTLKDKYYDTYLPSLSQIMRAGGYNPRFTYERSLQSAFSGIFSFTKSEESL
ncbi:CDK-activating kinase assembly factor [Gigaspora margarita]|uniref:RNA polymerase II transcription factor B subunit 3 n=1 Tax=Gigaspora margarita TaxID=4874 RepID=A0A8H4EKP9_GIGMA|nr:CDK-activating kinase assembly factor [Gigaspora margarita]